MACGHGDSQHTSIWLARRQRLREKGKEATNGDNLVQGAQRVLLPTLQNNFTYRQRDHPWLKLKALSSSSMRDATALWSPNDRFFRIECCTAWPGSVLSITSHHLLFSSDSERHLSTLCASPSPSPPGIRDICSCRKTRRSSSSLALRSVKSFLGKSSNGPGTQRTVLPPQSTLYYSCWKTLVWWHFPSRHCYYQ